MRRDDLDSVLEKLRPVIGGMADAFWLGALLDPDRRRDTEAVARAMAAELLDESYQKKHILLEPPPSNGADGPHRLGEVVYAGRSTCPFGLRKHELPQHVLIIGRTGAGKTNLAHLLLCEMLRSGIPFMVLDWRLSYRDLGGMIDGRKVRVCRPGEDESLSFNPFAPPPRLTRMQREAYTRDVVSTICTTYLPGNQLLSTRGAEHLILRAIESLRETGREPATSNDIRWQIEGRPIRSREQDWQVSALAVLHRLTTGPVGQLLNCTGPGLTTLLDRPVVLELDALGSESDRALLMHTLLLWLYYHRLSEGKSSSLRHLLVVEEAHNVFLRTKGSQTIPDAMIRQMRDLGQGLVLLDQNPSLLSVPALGNTGTTFCMNLKHGDDIAAAGKSLSLPREDWENIGKLPMGQAIVRVQGRWPKPFLVRVPEFERRPDNAPESVPDTDGTDSLRRKVDELQRAVNEALRALPEEDREKDGNVGIGMKERQLLQDVAEHPLATVTERYRRLGWSAHTGTRTKKDLLYKGVLVQKDIPVPKGSVALLSPTAVGKSVMETSGFWPRHLPKNASLQHEYYRLLLRRRLEANGYSVEDEVRLDEGGAVDLVATRNSEKIAVEIETGKSDAARNVEKCLRAGFPRIVVVTSDTATRDRIRISLPDPRSSNMKLLTLREFLSARTATGNGHF